VAYLCENGVACLIYHRISVSRTIFICDGIAPILLALCGENSRSKSDDRLLFQVVQVNF